MRKIEIQKQNQEGILSYNRKSTFKEAYFIFMNFPKMDWVFSSWLEKIILFTLFLWGVYGLWLLFNLIMGLL